MRVIITAIAALCLDVDQSGCNTSTFQAQCIHLYACRLLNAHSNMTHSSHTAIANATLMDTLLSVPTAESIDVVLRPANVFARSRAFMVDALIRLVWLVVSNLLLLLLLPFLNKGWIIGIGMVNVFAIMWLYPVLFEVFAHGQTPGKKLFGLRVMADNGTPIGWSASLLRNLLRLVDALPVFYGAGMICMLLHPQGKRVGDMLAGSVVVYVPLKPGKTDWSSLSAIVPQAPPAKLTREEQQAILAYAERQIYLPRIRRQELANLCVQALCGHTAPATDAVTLVLSWAKYILGSQLDSIRTKP